MSEYLCTRVWIGEAGFARDLANSAITQERERETEGGRGNMSHLPLISEWKHTIHQGMAANNHTQSRNDRLKVSCHYGNGSCIKIILEERSRFHQEKGKKMLGRISALGASRFIMTGYFGC